MVIRMVSAITNMPLIGISIESVTCQRAHQPVRQFDADLARAEHRAVGLLQDQAQAPGREQRVERALVEMAYQRPFDQHAERADAMNASVIATKK